MLNLLRSARALGGRALRWLVTGVVLVAAIVGLLFITRGTAVHWVRGVGADGTPVAPAESAFPLTVALLTGAPILPGNRVELALDGDGTFPRLWADLRAARRSITFQMYYLAPGRVADTLAAILAERAQAGVAVWLLYDAFGSDLPDDYFRGLRSAGVRAVAFRPLRFRNLWVVQNRSHVRGIVVDERIGWTGGFGIDDKWLGGGRHAGEWRETNARFEGPAVHQLQAAFVAAWAEATGELLTGRVPLHVHEGGVAWAGLLFTAPTLGSTPAERYLALSVAGARQRLYVTNAYFAPDVNFVALLTRAARRGVDVRILVGGPSTDVTAARQAARGRYEELLEAGVRVYEYRPTTLHAKTFVVDGVWVSIGTMNFDNRSLALNDESTLMVLDSVAGRRMEAVFDDDLRYAREIDLESFRRRPWIERVVEWAANLITPLL
ncbi:MAG TPA: phospholipase D-like domain-containing protein [Tepidiformaceae bacterium]|nr:phospholipase D-like domain-containing protein [Tepidiformaceae bacterium]